MINLLYLTYTMPKPSSPVRGVFTYYRLEELTKSLEINLHVVTFEHLHHFFKYKKHYNLKDIGYEADIEVTSLIKIENPYRYCDLLRSMTVNYLCKYVRENNIQLVHAHFVRDAYYAYKIKKYTGVPYIVTAHGFDIYTAPLFSKTVFKKSQTIISNADKVIYVSNALKKDADKFLKKSGDSVVIYNGYDRNKFRLKVKDSTVLKLGYCGLLIDRKNVNIFPHIASLLDKKGYSFTLDIIGDGPLRKRLQKKFTELGLANSVVFYGNLPNNKVAGKMKEWNIFLFPSKKESFGVALIEALASGCMAVTSDIPALREVLGPGGVTVPFGDNFEERFAEAIIQLRNNPVDPDVLKKYTSNFLWSNTVAKEIEVYKSFV